MHKTISIYFSGTGFSINDDRFLASSLYARTKENESQIKMGFNGCGVDYGLTGTLFGTGLDQQCNQVIERVLQEIQAGHQITLNIYGHSRGGIAALLLAKQLAPIDKEKLHINLALLDPVPGNLITTSTIDPFKISLANKTMDLMDCKPLKKVLVLYPHIPLPAIACHAPLLVSYPQETVIHEEVINGCHAQAEQLAHPSSKLARLRIEEFLIQNGTQLQTDRDYSDTEAMKASYLSCYKQELAYVNKAFSRDTHSVDGRIIIATPGAKYLNSHHKALANDTSQEPVSLSIQTEKGLFFWSKPFFIKYPLVAQILKWTFITLSISSLLYATGGFAAIPLLMPLVFQLKTLSIIALSPVVGSTLATLWYGVTKPALLWCANKFFYPYYELRKLEVLNRETSDSTKKLMSIFDVKPSQTNSPEVGLDLYQGKSSSYFSRKITEEKRQHECAIHLLRL